MTERLRATRLYITGQLSANAVIELGESEAHYLGHVLRKREADTVLLFNGRDGGWQATITKCTKKQVQLQVHSQFAPQTYSPDVWLIFVPIKRARLDFMAQKATELGASKIWPVQSEYGQMKRLNDQRLKANAIEAAEQTERLDVPEIGGFEKLSSLLSNWPDDRALLFCDEGEAGAPQMAPEAVLPPLQGKPVAILIGPEGGFSPQERADIRALPQSVSMSLGPRILRSDTAALAALSLFQAYCGDWRNA